MKKPVTQEEPMGCGIACVAFVLGTTYNKAKTMFKHAEHARTRGFYCGEMVGVLNAGGLNYSFSKYRNGRIAIGSVVFIERNANYPAGHFLVKTRNGWMNPWINFPSITPAKSGFQRKLPGKVQWVIYPRNAA